MSGSKYTLVNPHIRVERHIDETHLQKYWCSYAESEEHVLLNCPLYNDLRNVLFIYANTIDVEFVNMLPGGKLIFLLSNDNVVNMCTKTLCDILTRRMPLLYDNV